MKTAIRIRTVTTARWPPPYPSSVTPPDTLSTFTFLDRQAFGIPGHPTPAPNSPRQGPVRSTPAQPLGSHKVAPLGPTPSHPLAQIQSALRCTLPGRPACPPPLSPPVAGAIPSNWISEENFGAQTLQCLYKCAFKHPPCPTLVRAEFRRNLLSGLKLVLK